MMDISRISSGLPLLDAALQGGYPKGSVISLIGKSDQNQKYFNLKFLVEKVEDDTSSLYITTKDSIEVITTYADKFALHHDNLVYLDAVHWRVKRINPKLNSPAQFVINNLTDLNSLLAKIMEACNERNVSKILFDTPSSILLYSTPGKEQVFKFFELLTAYTRSNNITLVYTLEKEVHPKDVIATLQFLSDGVIRMENGADNANSTILEVENMLLTDFDRDPIVVPNFQ